MNLYKTAPCFHRKDNTMWRKPVITEICVGAEINSYVSAGKN